MHGTVQRGSEKSDNDHYVITEDDYVDYLTRADISQLFPAKLAGKLKNSHLLFLGYGLRDWNMRVMLYRLWRQSKLLKKSWAIQLKPDPMDKTLWGKKDVEIIDVKLDEFIDELSSQLTERLKPRTVTAS